MSGPSRLTAKPYDIASLGELLIDFTEAGRSPAGMRLFEQNPGGAVSNMLACASRLGAGTAFLGKVGRDMHGLYLKETLEAAGVDTAGLVLADDVFTTLAFVALQDGERTFSFARKPGADTCLRPEEVSYQILDDATVFHFGSLSLSDEPSRSATHRAVEYARARGAVISYDPNYRPTLWRSREEAAAEMRRPLSQVDLMKLSDEETGLLTGHEEPEAAAAALWALGIRVVVVTLGKAGALACVEGRCRTVPGYGIPASDTTGAGDAFWGGFLYRLLASGKDHRTLTLEEAADFARFGNAAATVCVTRRGGIPAMPTLAEVEAMMARHP